MGIATIIAVYMMDPYNLFTIGSTGFGNDNPLRISANGEDNTVGVFDIFNKKWWDPEVKNDYSIETNAGQSVSNVFNFFGKLNDPDTWLRGGIIVIGIVFLIAGLFLLGNKAATVVVSTAQGATP